MGRSPFSLGRVKNWNYTRNGWKRPEFIRTEGSNPINNKLWRENHVTLIFFYQLLPSLVRNLTKKKGEYRICYETRYVWKPNLMGHFRVPKTFTIISCKNEFNVRQQKNSGIRRTYPRFETEAWGNSEMGVGGLSNWIVGMFRGIISRFRGKVGQKQTLNVKFRLNPTPTDAEAILKESVFEWQ